MTDKITEAGKGGALPPEQNDEEPHVMSALNAPPKPAAVLSAERILDLRTTYNDKAWREEVITSHEALREQLATYVEGNTALLNERDDLEERLGVTEAERDSLQVRVTQLEDALRDAELATRQVPGEHDYDTPQDYMLARVAGICQASLSASPVEPDPWPMVEAARE